MVTVAELQRENDALRAQLMQLAATNSAQLDRLLATNAELTAEVARLSDRVSELLAVARRRQRPPEPALVRPSPPALDASVARAFADRPTPPALPEKIKPAPKPRRPTGRKALPRHLEAEEHALRPDTCAHCGSHALDVAEVLTEEKLHVVKEHQRRRVVQRTTCRCGDCGRRTTPRSLPAPYERSKVTCEWLAWLVDQKFAMLTPLDRLRRDLAARGITLAMGSLVNFIERAADLLAAVDGHHWRMLLAGRWMASDGTGLKVLVPKLPAAHNGYLELYRNGEVAVFQYEPDKAADAVVAKLQPFRGTLTADAEHRFNAVYATGRVIEAGCNAHGRRKFRDAEATRPDLAAEGGAFIAAMYVAEQEAQARGLAGAKLRAHRRRHIAPVVKRFRRWLDAVAPTLVRAARRRGRLLPAPRRRAVPFPRRPRRPDRQLADRARVPDRRQTSPQHALCRQHRGCASRVRPARHRRDLPRHRRACAGLPCVGLRAPRHSPRPLRTAGRPAHPGRVQAHPGLIARRPWPAARHGRRPPSSRRR